MRPKKAFLSLVLALLLGTAAGVAPAALAGNTQTGDNKTSTDQSGENSSGDANTGQITGVTADGQTSIDATNSTDHADVQSGDARGSNTADSFTGLDASTTTALNTQEGDNTTKISQDGEATSGDVSDGQIIAAVTSFGGSADIVASNKSSFNDVRSGRAKDENAATTFTGLSAFLFDGASATNVQLGDNKLKLTQTNPTSTGNATSGQIIGVTSDGTTTVDATNLSAHNDVDTVNAFGANSVDAFIGLLANATSTALASNNQEGDNSGSFNQDAPGTSNAVNAFVGQNALASGAASSTNVQEGDNKLGSSQDSPISAQSYDSLAGQVVGDVTSAGGSADLVLANTSTWNDVEVVGVAGQVAGVTSAGTTSVDATNLSDNNDVEGGVTYASTSLDAFVGLDAISGLVATAINLQEGDNKLSSSQSSSAVSGEPVAGQIIGVVTGVGGSSSVVLANASVDSDVKSETARDAETLAAFIGLQAASETNVP